MVGGKIVPPPPPPQYKRDFKSLIFVSFQQITSERANFINLFKGALSSGVDRFFLTCPCQKLEKTMGGSMREYIL